MSSRIIHKLKRLLLVILILAGAFLAYVFYITRNTENMTFRQKLLKAVYPVFMWFSGKNENSSAKMLHNENAQPAISFYSLTDTTISGKPFSFAELKGKKILLVNTASDCGYTNQYDALQKLQEQYKDRLIIIGFPANDFKEQEKGSNADIEGFCRKNFGVSFPLMQKSKVIKSSGQNPVFQWLSDSTQNGWCSQAPVWNFCKYLVDEKGVLIYYFAPAIDPFHKTLVSAIEK